MAKIKPNLSKKPKKSSNWEIVDIPIAQAGIRTPITLSPRPTEQDSLNLYNNAIELQKFYDSKKQFYDEPNISKFDDSVKNYITSGELKKETLKNKQLSNSNREIIANNIDPNIEYFSDLIPGAIDPAAPLMRYDLRIDPQHVISYTPLIDPSVDMVDMVERDIDKEFRNFFKDYNLPEKDSLGLNKLDHDISFLGNKELYTPEEIAHKSKRDSAVAEKMFRKYGIDKKKVLDFYKAFDDSYYNDIEKYRKQELEAWEASNTPGAHTVIPMYDPIAVKPTALLTPEERAIKEERYPSIENIDKESYSLRPKVEPINFNSTYNQKLQPTLTKFEIPNEKLPTSAPDWFSRPLKNSERPISKEDVGKREYFDKKTGRSIGVWEYGGQIQDQKELKIKKSTIEGKGLFANKSFLPNEVIGTAHIDGQPTKKIGMFHNHSENPNTESIIIGNKRILKPLKKIKKGEEITVNYRNQPELEQPENFYFPESSVTEYPMMQTGGRTPIPGTQQQYQAYQDSLDLYNTGQISKNTLKNLSQKYNQPQLNTEWDKWLNSPNGIKNNQLGVNAALRLDDYNNRFPENNGSLKIGNSIANTFTKPVQPIIPPIIPPINTDQNERPKLQTLQLDRKEGLLESNPIKLGDINPIPFESGSYFTRKRKPQEADRGKMEYFDKKTGRSIGLYDDGGELPEAGSGYKVVRSSERKGKTHKVTGPDGTVKFFGDSKLGQHPKDPARKAAFYARHKKNLAGNPYFRAFARKTWEEGGELDFAQDGLYNMQRALDLGYKADQTEHWPSVDSETGMWLKSKKHPTAWMEYMYGYALNPEVQKQFKNPVVNPEGYFGENQLQYIPKEAFGGNLILEKYQRGGNTLDDKIVFPMLYRTADAADYGEKNIIPPINKFFGSIGNNIVDYMLTKPELASTAINFKYGSRPWLFENVRPVEYPGIFNSAIILGMGAAGKNAPPVKDEKGDYAVGEEAWRKGLGLNTKSKYIIPSKYKPSKSTEKDAKYYTLKGVIDPELILEEAKKRNLKTGENVILSSLSPYMKEGFMDREEFSNIDPLQNFKMGVGEDEKGKYVSIYDKYDFEGPLSIFTTPYEFYDRYYYKPEEKKAKKTNGGSVWEILPQAQTGTKTGYSWSTQQAPSYQPTFQGNYASSKTTGNRALTEKEIQALKVYNEKRVQEQKEAEYAARQAEYQQRQARIKESVDAQNQPLSAQNIMTQSQSTGDKMSLAMNTPFGNPTEYPTLSGYVEGLDFINPLKFIGDMGSGVGAVPYNVQQGNYGQALMGVAAPLAVGALAGIGTQGIRQFTNNLVNPFAGFGNPLKRKPNISSSVDDVADFSKYPSQLEAVQARAERLLSQKNKKGWNEQLTPNLEERLTTAVKRHNPASDYPGEKLGANTGGRTATEVSRHPINADKLDPNSRTYDPNAVPIYLNNANKARIAAHETGHYYSNSLKEGTDWQKYFDFSDLPYKTSKYLKGKSNYGNFSNEIRERAAQLKDYIAFKNKIPLNQDFKINRVQLDDALENYVRDTGLDNAMTAFINALKKKDNVSGFLKEMNKRPLSVAPYIIGIGGAGALGATQAKNEPYRNGGKIKPKSSNWEIVSNNEWEII